MDTNPRGYVTAEQYQLALGKALTAWTGIEHTMATIFIALVRPAFWIGAGHAFHAVQNFRDKTNMVHAAARRLPHALKAEWQTHLKNINTAAGERNAIVHAQILQSSKFGYHGAAPLFDQMATGAVNWKRQKNESIGLNRLARAETAFTTLKRDLVSFRSRVKALPV